MARFPETRDRAWEATETFFWNMIEINTGLICACIPTLKPFFKELTVKTFNRKSWSFGRKASENEDALGDGRDYGHRLYTRMEHSESNGQATPSKISLGQLDPERSLSGGLEA